MSLKVWLPLDGDLHNQGCGNIEATGINTVINNDGKIGKCYYCNSSSRIYSDLFTPTSNNFSICCWYKMNSKNEASGYIIGLSRASEPSFMLYKYGNTYFRLYIDSYSNYTHNLDLTTWHHLTITYNGTDYCLYIDGVYKYKRTKTVDYTNHNYRIFLNCRSNNSNTSGAGSVYAGPNYYNDLRYYDHCLSAAEVKEISQGLVLHYKLDTQYFKSGTNLVTDITAGGQTTKLTDGRLGIITSGTNADTYFTINLSESITNGTTYHFSCDASGISEGQYWNFPLGAQSNTSLPCKIYNGHNEFVFTANDINWGTNKLFMDDLNRPDWTNPATFYNFVLTKDAVYEVKDSSGYNNNGEIVNTPILINDSPRYTSALFFNSGPYVKKTNFNFTTNQWTISCWFKKTSSVTSSYETICGLTRGNGSDANKKFSLYIYNNKVGFVGEASPYSNIMTIDNSLWHHVCATNDQGTYKYYIDGVLKGTYTNSTNFTDCTDFVVGGRAGAAEATSIGTPWGGYISDVRLYATALLDVDIKKLYNTSMSIDNNQNIHVFELIENQNKISITKTGRLICDELNEDTVTKLCKFGIIETAEIIEK